MRALGVWVVGLVGAACGGGDSPPPCTGSDCPCEVGAARCDGTCIDVTTDSANCGGCSNDCLGSACVGGICWPETLAVVPNAPAAIAVAGDRVVFATAGATTSSGAVYRVPKTGGPLEILHHGLGVEPALAVTTGAILVADSGQAEFCRSNYSAGGILSITDEKTTLYSMGRRCAHWLLPIDGGLTWVEAALLGGTNVPAPWIARLSEGALPDESPVLLYGPRPHAIRDLIQSGATLIWREGGSGSHTIMQMPIAGGAAAPIVTVPGSIAAHAADAEHVVYVWNDSVRTRVVLRSLATGAEKTIAELADGFIGEHRIALDSPFVYWIREGELWGLDLRTSGRRQLASGAQELAQDERFLYVFRRIEHGGPRSEVLRIRKPASTNPSSFDPFDGCRDPFRTCRSEPFVDRCVDVATDLNHCGDCGTLCDAGQMCADGVCVCAPTSLACGAGCVDPSTDEAHCGRCGRSCAGGQCFEGDCTPVQIIGERPSNIVQDAGALYYPRGTQVRRLDKQSTGATTLAQFSNAYFVGNLALDASRVYAAVATSSLFGDIHALAKDGSSSPIELYANRYAPRQVAVAGDTVLWIEDATFNERPVRLVYGASNGSGILGSFTTPGLYPGSEDDQSLDIAVVGSTVYWLLKGWLVGSGQPRGAIVRIDLAAAPPVMSLVATLDRDPAAFAIANGRIYVTTPEEFEGVLLSVPMTGGPVSVHATGLYRAGDIASTAGGDLYWVEGSLGIRHLAPGAGVPRVVLGRALNTYDLVLADDDWLYTTTYPGIFRMTR